MCAVQSCKKSLVGCFTHIHSDVQIGFTGHYKPLKICLDGLNKTFTKCIPTSLNCSLLSAFKAFYSFPSRKKEIKCAKI